MPRHKDTESERVAGEVPAGSPAFYPQEDFPRGYVEGDLIQYNAETGLWERVSELEFSEWTIKSLSPSGGYRITNIRLDENKKVVITYDDTPIP